MTFKVTALDRYVTFGALALSYGQDHSSVNRWRPPDVGKIEVPRYDREVVLLRYVSIWPMADQASADAVLMDQCAKDRIQNIVESLP